MDDISVPMLVDAKTEYTKQLTLILRPFLYDGIKSIYEDCKTYCEDNKTNNILLVFQETLSKIPKWNQEIIDTEINRIIKDSGCDWLEDLITAVFVSHTKILTSIQVGKRKKKINLQVPKVDIFIHKCYIECAREFWKNPYLFKDNIDQCDYQRNMRDCEGLISNCICETIRKLLPVKHILKEYLGDDVEDETEDISKLNSNNLKMLVQKEIENYSKEVKIADEPSNDTEVVNNVTPKIDNNDTEVVNNVTPKIDNNDTEVVNNVTPKIDNNDTPEVVNNVNPKVDINDTLEVVNNVTPNVDINDTPKVVNNVTPEVAHNDTELVNNDTPKLANDIKEIKLEDSLNNAYFNNEIVISEKNNIEGNEINIKEQKLEPLINNSLQKNINESKSLSPSSPQQSQTKTDDKITDATTKSVLIKHIDIDNTNVRKQNVKNMVETLVENLDEDLNKTLDNDLEEVNIYAVNNEINNKNNNIDFLRDI